MVLETTLVNYLVNNSWLFIVIWVDIISAFQFVIYNMGFNILDVVFPQAAKDFDQSSTFSFGKKPILDQIDAIWCGFDYQNEFIRDTIHRIKNGGEFSLTQDLSLRLYNQLISFYKKIKNQNSLESVDLRIMFESIFDNTSRTLISYIPSDKDRVLRRGFHLPQLLAEEIFEIFGDHVREASTSKVLDYFPVLIKSSATASQSELGREERIENNRGKFAVINTDQLKSFDNIVLIDDICTTTSTLSECGKVIKSSFPKMQVFGLAVASN
jgi:predicted amidophosphoribosyltransferase